MAGSRGSPRQIAGRVSGTRSLRLSLIVLGVVTVMVAGIEVAIFASAPHAPLWVLVLYVAVGVEYVVGGLVAWSRRPINRTGMLLCVGGLMLLVAALENTSLTALTVTGLVLAQAPVAAILHILLAFPSGRLKGWAARGLVVGGYVVTIGLRAPQYLFGSVSGVVGLLQVARRPDLAHAGLVAQECGEAVVLVLSAWLLAARLQAASRAQRRVLAAVYCYGVAALLFLELSAHVLPPLFGFGAVTVFVLQISVLAGIPVAFGLGVRRGGFARTGEIDELALSLDRSSGDRSELSDALAVALGDDSLALVFRAPEDDRYVDAVGAVVELPRSGSHRAAVEIELGGVRVGAIAYDPVLIDEPELVRAAGRVVARSLERDRLTAALLASRNALSESRARIVDAGDRERRRIARDLHDGLQGRLVILALSADRLAAGLPTGLDRGVAVELGAGLEAASSELRALVQGVMPALLIEHGLYAATEDLVDRVPLPTRLQLLDGDGPLPERVQSAGYFVVAEAVTNAVKHSQARELSVRLGRVDGHLEIEVRDDGVGGARLSAGTGLSGIADRVDVLGGRLRVTSPLGAGTVVSAEVPCGS
jgi:signal transduction histidine kinase